MALGVEEGSSRGGTGHDADLRISSDPFNVQHAMISPSSFPSAAPAASIRLAELTLFSKRRRAAIIAVVVLLKA